MMLSLEIIAFIITIVLGVMWILIPERNWEPWTVLCGAVTVASELIRRLHTKPRLFSSFVTVPTQHGPKSADQTAQWLRNNVHTAKLSESLPRALSFAKYIGDSELERWIRLELYGYTVDGGMTENDVVPEYRAVTGRWMDQFNRMLDISHYPDISILNEYRFRFGVGKLEDLAARNEMQNIVDDHLINLLRENMGVDMIRFCFSPIEVRGVLDTIRNKLAEMVLDRLFQARTP